MSGFEVAGIVLGALPLLISALSAYKANKSTISVWKKYRGLLDDLIHRLETHRTLYYLNILSLLREARVPEVLQYSDPTEEQCIQILGNSRAGVHVDDYLRHLYPRFLKILRHYETVLKEVASCLSDISRPKNVSNRGLEAIINASRPVSGSPAIKARWKFTINKDRLKALIDDIETERSSLGKLIKGAKSSREWEKREPTAGSEKLAERFRKVSQCATLLYQAACGCWACEHQHQHTILLRLDHRIPADTHMASYSIPINFGLYFPLETKVLHEVDIISHPVTTPHALIEPPTREIVGLFVPRIEVSRYLECSPTSKVIRSICNNAQKARIQGQVLTLNLTPNTLELSEEVKACKPCEATVSLAQVLGGAERNRETRMLPLEQTVLALNVACSVLQLRTTVWCPKRWNSKTIKIPVQSTTTLATIACTPYLENAVDGAILRDSQCRPSLDTQAIQSTMLELAILLLEIFHHKSLESWAESYGEGNMCSERERIAGAIRWLRMSGEDRAEMLLPDQVRAVEGCLEYCVKSKLDWDIGFQDGFSENIIKPLRRIALA